MSRGSGSTPAVVSHVTRREGIAGQYEVTADVVYDQTRHVARFVASTYGGPVVAIMESGAQVFVARTVLERLGSRVDEAWVRGYFA